MSYDTNVYYNATYYGLTLVAEHELSEPCYTFDTLACWKNEAGEFFIATDSGCSCPTPFESYDGLADLTGPLTREQVLTESKSLRKQGYEPKYDPEGWKAFKQAIREA